MVLPPMGIAKELTRIARHPFATSVGMPAPSRAPRRKVADARPSSAARSARASTSADMLRARGPADEPEESGLDAVQEGILLLLRRHTGVDFTLYRASTVTRRIHRRMVINQITTMERLRKAAPRGRGGARRAPRGHAHHVDRLLPEPEGVRCARCDVVETGTATSTGTPSAYGYPVVPPDRKRTRSSWPSSRRRKACLTRPRLQMFATDLSRRAVDVARVGRYASNLLRDLAPERITRFFEEEAPGRLPRAQGGSGAGRLRTTRPPSRAAVLAPGARQLPQRAHLPGARDAAPGDVHLRPRPRPRWVPVPRRLGVSCVVRGEFDARRRQAQDLRTDRPRRRPCPRGPRDPARDATTGSGPSRARGDAERALADVGVARAADRVALGRYAPRRRPRRLRAAGRRVPRRHATVAEASRRKGDLRRAQDRARGAAARPCGRRSGRRPKTKGRGAEGDAARQARGAGARADLEVIPLRHSGKRYFLVCIETAPAKAARVPAARSRRGDLRSSPAALPEGTQSVRVLRQSRSPTCSTTWPRRRRTRRSQGAARGGDGRR